MHFKHFIFDLDGTLIDTEEAVLKTWKYTLKQYGYEYSLDEVRVVLGVTTDIGLQRLNASVDVHFIQRWHDNYGMYASEATFFDGAREMLKVLKSKGCSLGIVSSRSKGEFERFFMPFHLDVFFSVIVLEEDTNCHKPHPEPLLKYIELTGANKRECIYIGDMPSDVQCANDAGTTSGLITWNGSGISVDEAKMIFQDPMDICELAMRS